MLKKINRIGKKKEFREVLKKGRMYQSPIFGLLVLDLKDEEKKFGFVVSKKISKLAVERNRVKRLLAEGVRKNLNLVKEGTRGVFLPRKIMLGMKMEQVEKEIKKYLMTNVK